MGAANVSWAAGSAAVGSPVPSLGAPKDCEPPPTAVSATTSAIFGKQENDLLKRVRDLMTCETQGYKAANK